MCGVERHTQRERVGWGGEEAGGQFDADLQAGEIR